MNVSELIGELFARGANLQIDGPDLVVESDRGVVSDLLDELRCRKREVMSALNARHTWEEPFQDTLPSDIIPGDERQSLDLIGRSVTFLLEGSVEGCVATPSAVFAQGIVVGQKWLGFTARGKIPEYELTIKTSDGRQMVRRLVDHYVRADDCLA